LLLFKWLDQRKGFFDWGVSEGDSKTRRSWVPFAFESGKEGQTELQPGHPGTWLICTLSFGTLGVSYGLEKLMILLLPTVYKMRVWMLFLIDCLVYIVTCTCINLKWDAAAEAFHTGSCPHVQDALVVQSIKNNPHLSVLDLSHCPNLSGFGVKQVLEQAQRLVSLDISSCMLGATGASICATALPKCL
jgi:hypothetical protein